MYQWYKVLGVDPQERDLRVIKKAYAKQLKTTRPDDDREGFMKLRQAFEHAKMIADHGVSDFIMDEPQESEIEIPESVTVAEPIFTPHAEWVDVTPPAISPELAAATAQLESLFENIVERHEPIAWTALVGSVQELDLDDYSTFESILIEDLLNLYADYEDAKDESSQGLGLKRQKPKPPLPKSTLAHIFKLLDWEAHQNRPFYLQESLSYLAIEAGLQSQPKIEKPVFIWSGSWPDRIVSAVLIMALVFLSFATLKTSPIFTDYDTLDRRSDYSPAPVFTEDDPQSWTEAKQNIAKDLAETQPQEENSEQTKPSAESEDIEDKKPSSIVDRISPELKDRLGPDVMAQLKQAEIDKANAPVVKAKRRLSEYQRRKNQHSNAKFFLYLLGCVSLWYFRRRIVNLLRFIIRFVIRRRS